MRLFFPNTTRPKKAAKHLAGRLGLSLSQVQRGVAVACGYRDWHELEGALAAEPPSALDQDLAKNDFVARHVHLTVTLARALNIPDGDAQYALADARLTGDQRPELADQIAVRLGCFRATSLPEAPPRTRGAVGRLKSPGRNGEVVILRRFGRPTETVTHQAITTVADFEYVSPRTAPSLFLPMRLYLPYGVWTEHDGSEVIFARDYKPLWRIHVDGAVERLEPWLWIHVKKETHLWEDAYTPWRTAGLKESLEDWLQKKGIAGLPVLADALPLLVNAPIDGRLSMEKAADLLQASRSPAHPVPA